MSSKFLWTHPAQTADGSDISYKRVHVYGRAQAHLVKLEGNIDALIR